MRPPPAHIPSGPGHTTAPFRRTGERLAAVTTLLALTGVIVAVRRRRLTGE